MHDTPENRVHDLIEELRADIDFELDDAVTAIVRNLPEEYFESVRRENQLTHLKALVASRICNLQSEIFVPCCDGNQIAVVGRRNYRGQLAKILNGLPTGRRILSASAYTSASHDFIIDLFDLAVEPPVSEAPAIDPAMVDVLTNAVACSPDDASSFLSLFANLRNGEPLARRLPHLFAANQKCNGNPAALHWWQDGDAAPALRTVTLAVCHENEKLVLFQLASLVSQHTLDIRNAKMDVLHHSADSESESRIILATFELECHADFDCSELEVLPAEIAAALG